MNVPYSWLREFLPKLPEPEAVRDVLDSLGLAVEEVHHLPAPPAGVVFGRVLKAEEIPGTELKKLEVDVGREVVTLVSGAPNARAGIGLAVARSGVVLPDGTEIGAREIRGVTSEGMALSPAELGVGEYAGGLLELPADALEPGRELAEVWPEEVVFELELTPNRADAFSVLGVARDLAAKLELELVEPPVDVEESPVPRFVTVEVEDPEGCDRYLARYAGGLEIGPSPLEAQRKLLAVGLRPINNVVDATNYTMWELGNPLHAFDLEEVKEGIVVRRAKAGEKIVTLDGEERQLAPEDLVIARRVAGGTEPVAVAGVMGAANSEVTEETREVVLEAAHFDPVRVRLTARRLGLSTDSSYRFERGVDPNLPPRAAARFLHLLQRWTGCTVGDVVVDVGGDQPRREVPFRPSYANRLLGTEFDVESQLAALERLGCEVAGEAEPYAVRPPTWRVDLNLEEDLVEEVGRILGYEHVPTEPLALIPAPDNLNAEEPYRREEALRRAMRGLGGWEAINYTWQSPAYLSLARAPEPRRFLKNPLDSSKNALRTALYPGLLETLAVNREERHRFFFELGHVFLDVEETRLAAVLGGPLVEATWQAAYGEGYPAIKGLLEALAARSGARVEVRPQPHPPLHPGVSGTVFWNGEPRGFIGRLHPEVEEALELGPVHLFELVLPLPEAVREFRDLPKFPPARRDLAVVVPEDVPHVEVLDLIRQFGGPYLEAAELFDVYRGEPLPEGQKSLAYHLTFRHPERTLTDAEVDEEMGRVIAAVIEAGYKIRE
ncbi:phenylalanine--tRNA ligase subunit beta [Oceanithermus sp.]|uniref:phenylalanine--tRNA ligase subunit beta n=1 Tax=Oceanithermus sp. TaxID=2268145 RepID=UPI0025CEE76D|nr:phenylalanine--tRNA ligase subunit beta [Oceanithermus sp.]